MAKLITLLGLFFILSHFSYCQNWHYFDSLRVIYVNKQSYDTALVYGEKSLMLVAENVGNTDTLYANMLIALVEIYYYKGNFSKAVEYGKQEIEIRKNKTGTTNYAYVNSCEWLGLSYQHMGNVSNAESLLLEGMKYSKIVLGEKHPEYATAVNNLAELYHNIGNYSSALPLLLTTKKIYKESLGENHPDYARSLNNLAGLYKEIGNFSAAEQFYLEAEILYEKIYTENHPLYTMPLSGLGTLYLDMGNYSAAEKIFIKVIAIRKKAIGENHAEYATALNNLANLYLEIHNYDAAEPLFIKAKETWKATLGEKHPYYSYSLNNLAVLYMKMKKFDLAEPLILESIRIRKEVYGINHPGYGDVIENLASLFSEIQKYEEAIPLMLESLTISKNIFGDEHLDYAFVAHNMGQLYSKMRNYSAAEPFYFESLKVINNSIKKNFAFLSEKEKELFFNTMAAKYFEFYSFALRRKLENNSITQIVYNCILKNKGLLLRSTSLLKTTILNSNDSLFIAQYNQWLNINKELSKLYSMSLKQRKKNTEDLEIKANSLEKEMVKRSQIFENYEKLNNLTWDSIRNSLKIGEAAIEFIRFQEGENKLLSLYCALIITPDCKQPEMIKLCNENDLELVLGKNSKNNLSNVNSIYGSNQKINEKLYTLIWQPMEKYLHDVKTVYYSPDGLLHKISFSSIGNATNQFLSDIYNLQLVSSTAKVVFPESYKLNQKITAQIYGGIFYSKDTIKEEVWKYLPGTKSEADKIYKIFNLNKINAVYFKEIKADEKEFKKSAGSASLIHIATHGFFYPEPKLLQKEVDSDLKNLVVSLRGGSNGFGVSQFIVNKNPLMRSGIIFAGANNVWNQKYAGDGEDGVLTALEVTQLDLQKVQLIVLSACETGLGDIKGNEGVYGLQRAFKMAGIKYLIMSLWQVPDKETSEFMTKFYEKLLFSTNIRKAFNETQLEMRKLYDPFYWGAFVLIE